MPRHTHGPGTRKRASVGGNFTKLMADLRGLERRRQARREANAKTTPKTTPEGRRYVEGRGSSIRPTHGEGWNA